jgi:hypothetical protein
MVVITKLKLCKFGNHGFVNLCYVRLLLLYSNVTYYINCCNTVMPLKCDPARKIVDDSGFPRTPDKLLKFCHVWWLEVFKTITSTCGSYYLGGSATARGFTLS